MDDVLSFPHYIQGACIALHRRISTRLKLECAAELISLDAWQITPVCKDRLTGSLYP
jgi:hypothetical protein